MKLGASLRCFVLFAALNGGIVEFRGHAAAAEQPSTVSAKRKQDSRSPKTWQRIRRQGFFTVSLDPDNLPYSARRGKLNGIEFELAQALAKRMGLIAKFDWINIRNETSLGKLLDGECDLVMGLPVDPRLQNEDESAVGRILFTRPYYRTGYLIFVRKNGPRTDRLAALKGEQTRRVGAQAGSLADFALKQRGYQRKLYGTQQAALKALAAGRIDYAYLWSNAAWSARNSPDLAVEFVQASKLEDWRNMAAAVRGDDRVFRKHLDQAITQLAREKFIQRLLNRYAVPYFSPTEPGIKQSESSATGPEEPALREELLARAKKDQEARKRFFEWAKKNNRKLTRLRDAAQLDAPGIKEWIRVDEENRAWMKQIVKRSGWPGKTLVGSDGAHAAWLLVQHANRDRPFQKQCLKLMQQAGAGEVAPWDIAYLEDRIRLAEGRKQLYGTQVELQGDRWVVRNVEDPANLDKRRKTIGLPPVAVYLRLVQQTISAKDADKQTTKKRNPPKSPPVQTNPKKPDAKNQQSLNPFAGDEQATREGGDLFRQNCVGCHGSRGRGGKGPDLSDTRWLHGSGDEDLFKVIRNGLRGTTMKQMSILVSDEKIWKMIAFVRTLARAAGDPGWRPYLSGDPLAGKKLYFDAKGKAICAKCHAVNGVGGKIGPSLSLIAAQRSPKYLMESLLKPSADIHPNYQAVVVATKRGRVITGVQVNEDNFSIQLRDEKTGRLHSFFRRDLESVRKQKKSLMPDNLSEQLSVKELHDLFAYMMTLDGRKKSPKQNQRVEKAENKNVERSK